MIDLSDLTPGCVIVAYDGSPIETYPSRCPCGCRTSGLNWAVHNNSCRDELSDVEMGKIQFFEVIRKRVPRELRDSVVMGDWVVRRTGQEHWVYVMNARKSGGHTAA